MLGSQKHRRSIRRETRSATLLVIVPCMNLVVQRFHAIESSEANSASNQEIAMHTAIFQSQQHRAGQHSEVTVGPHGDQSFNGDDRWQKV